MNSDPFQKSFFDSNEPKNSFEFVKPCSQNKKDLKSTPILRSLLTCKNPKSSKPKQGFYALHNQLLAYYGVFPHI